MNLSLIFSLLFMVAGLVVTVYVGWAVGKEDYADQVELIVATMTAGIALVLLICSVNDALTAKLAIPHAPTFSELLAGFILFAIAFGYWVALLLIAGQGEKLNLSPKQRREMRENRRALRDPKFAGKIIAKKVLKALKAIDDQRQEDELQELFRAIRRSKSQAK